jgi:plastocyanin
MALGLALAAGTGGAASAAATRSVEVDDNFFSPRSLNVRSGTVVRWRWVGERPHNVTTRSFHSRTQETGTYARRFRRAGTTRVYCTLHDGMEMRVRVR